jgi:FkbM family methyltransferase
LKSYWPSKIYLYPYSRFIYYLFAALIRITYRSRPSYRKKGCAPERYSTLAESIFDIFTRPAGKKRYDYILNVKFESCNFVIRPFILSDIIMVSGFYEQHISNLLLDVKQGDIFMDVGAYIGRYTIPIGKKVGSRGRVIAFEPNQSSAEILDRNIALNNLSNVTVFRKPVGGNKKEVIYRISDRPMFSGIGLRLNPKFVFNSEMKMHSVALDEVVFGLGIERIDWLKIDVEGFEVEVLNGARNIIKNGSPRIIIEVAPENIEAVRKIFSEEGFSLSHIFGANYYAAKDFESRK